jgi:hypothetical protein
VTTPAPAADGQAATIADLGFPYDVPIELSAKAGEEIERIIADGPPEWVRDIQRQAPTNDVAIIRPDHKGRPDDIVITGDTFRMERMDKDTWWLAIYRGDKRVSIWLRRNGKRVDISSIEDEFGCVDDTKDEP